MGGVVMEKFGIQADSYGTGQVDVASRAPSVEEVGALCRPFAAYSLRVREGCGGGAGWLLSLHLNRIMGGIDPRGDSSVVDPELRERAVKAHLGLMAECETQNCLSTLMQHIRPQEWVNGVAEEVCAVGSVPGREELDLALACTDIAAGLMAG